MSEVTTLLQQIVSNTESNNAVWVAAVSGGAAVLGASISAIFSYFVTGRSTKSQEAIEEKRLRATIVAAERLRWLQEVRRELSEVYSQLDMQYQCIKQAIEAPGDQQLQQKIDDYSETIMKQVNMIFLMMNPEREDQKTLANSLQLVLAYILELSKTKDPVIDDAHYAKLKGDVFKAASSVGVATWSQVKNLE